MMRRDVFQAIADPTRRDILKLLSRRQLNLQAIAGHFDISRPAISKHIRILTECGLVAIEQLGRERFCTAKLQGLGEVSKWVGQYESFWNQRLDALGRHLSSQKAASKRKPTTKRKI